jgi:hypothetical protein
MTLEPAGYSYPAQSKVASQASGFAAMPQK